MTKEEAKPYLEEMKEGIKQGRIYRATILGKVVAINENHLENGETEAELKITIPDSFPTQEITVPITACYNLHTATIRYENGERVEEWLLL